MYLHVMLLAVVLSVTAMASVARLAGQRAIAALVPSVNTTTLDAQAAMSIAMMRYSSGAVTPATDGTLLSNQSLGSSSTASNYSAWLRDPADDQLNDHLYDDLQIVAVARDATTTAARTARISRTRAATSGLHKSAVAGGALTIFPGAKLSGSRPHRVYGNLDVSGGSISGPVELKGILSGANFDQTPQTFSTNEAVLPTGWLDAYRSQSQTIVATSLPLFSTPALFESEGFERDKEHWDRTGSDTSITHVTSPTRSGSRSIKVQFDSDNYRPSIYRKVSDAKFVKSHHQARATLWIYPSKELDFQVQIEIDAHNVGTVVSPPQTYAKVPASRWTSLIYNYRFPDGLDVTECRLRLTLLKQTDCDIHADDFSFVDITFPHNSRIIENEVITPMLNNYNTASGKPVTRIDCGGQTVALGNSRIVGTLLLDNPGANSGVYHTCRLTAIEPGWPAIISSSDLWLQDSYTLAADPTPRLLSEPDLDVNLNPDKAWDDYPNGIKDGDKEDTYACGIRGGVIAAGNCRLFGCHTITGYLMAGGNLSVESGWCTIQPGTELLRTSVLGFDNAPWDIRVIDRSRGSIADVYQVLGL